MKKLATEFCEAYKAKKFMVTKNGVDEKSEYLRKELEIKTYLPFREKRQLAEMVVTQNITEIDGIKKYDKINGYIGFVVATIMAHTNLEFGPDPVADYDLLAESGLLPQIIAEFQESYNECDVILKMAISSELEDNNVSVLIGHFLNKISRVLGDVSEKIKGFGLESIFGTDIKQEDIAKVLGLLDKLK